MVTAWSRVPALAFIEGCARCWDNGAIVHHALGSTAIELAGDRAVAQTKMTIGSRSMVEEVLCDVVCTGRFYDFFECRGGAWGIVLRQPVPEKDRPGTVRRDSGGVGKGCVGTGW